MPTRMNPMAGRYFNDPSFAAGLSNLASAFAPPSADEALGWAQLRGVNAQNAAADSFLAQDPNNPDFLALRGGLISGWGGSRENMLLDNAATLRGQDVNAATTLAANDADNEAQFRETLIRLVTNPDGRQGLDNSTVSEIAGFELPGFQPAGPVAPSETQVRGRLLADMPPGVQEAIMSDIDLVQTVGPDGQPIFTTEADAIGQPAYVNRGAEAGRRPVTLVAPDGTQFAGSFDPGTGQYMMPDGTPMPAGFSAFGLGQPTGTSDELGMTSALTNEYRRVQSAAAEVDMITNEIEALINSQAGAAGVVGTVQSVAQNIGQVAREVAMAVEQSGTDTPVTPETLRAMEARLSSGPFNPVFQQIRSYLLRLAYANAQISNPGGEVGQIALARELESLSSGMLGNDESIKAALSVSRQNAAIRRAAAEALRGNDVAAPTPLAAQNAGAPPPGGGTRMRYDANGNRIE